MFELHPQLAKDCFRVTELHLSTVLLMNDSQFPWTILVPRRRDIRDTIDLNETDYQQMWEESALLSRAMQTVFSPDKLNVAALGNMVSQLHIHHIARFTSDLAWPGPVWGKVEAKSYADKEKDSLVKKLKQQLQRV